MPQNASFFLRTRDLLISPKTTQRHFLFTFHPLSTVIFATATVLAFVLLRNSNFNFHCYTQREATPEKSARKCAETSRDFFRDWLQSAFTLANQLRWIAQQHLEALSEGNNTNPPKTKTKQKQTKKKKKKIYIYIDWSSGAGVWEGFYWL